MSLELNSKQDYKEFYGRNTEKMPLLVKEGRTPLSAAGLMKRRLEVLSDKPLFDAWFLNYFDTGDAVLYHPDGKIKIIHDSKLGRSLTPESRLSAGALVLQDGAYESADGEEFTRSELKNYVLGGPLKREQVEANPVWQALARGDRALLKQYADAVFAKGKEMYSYDTNMGIYLADAQKQPTMRLWYVGRLGNGSGACGGDLDGDYGRLVGVAPEALVVKNLEQRVEQLGDGKIRFNGIVYEPSSK